MDEWTEKHGDPGVIILEMCNKVRPPKCVRQYCEENSIGIMQYSRPEDEPVKTINKWMIRDCTHVMCIVRSDIEGVARLELGARSTERHITVICL